MKNILFLLLPLLFTCLTASAQSYESECRELVEDKVNSYIDDKEVLQMKEALRLFHEGHYPDEGILKRTHTIGIAYVLSESQDCNYGECSQPLIFPAALQIQEGKVGTMGIRKKGEDSAPKRPYSEFVRLFFAGRSTLETDPVKYLMTQKTLPIGLYNYSKLDDDCVVADGNYTYMRQNGNNLILVTTPASFSNVMIYVFQYDYIKTLLQKDKDKGKKNKKK